MFHRMMPVVIAAALVGSTGCAATQNNPCGPHGKPRSHHYPVVATTVEPDGTILDWIPIGAQTPDGRIPTPPPMLPPPPGTEPSAEPSRGTAPAQPETARRGPPGTVPIARPKVLTCECEDGYISRPGSPCVNLSESCVGPGGEASAKEFTQCCPGLTGMMPSRVMDGRCEELPLGHVICVRCGDGVCGAGESPCNCASDCPMTPPAGPR